MGLRLTSVRPASVRMAAIRSPVRRAGATAYCGVALRSRAPGVICPVYKPDGTALMYPSTNFDNGAFGRATGTLDVINLPTTGTYSVQIDPYSANVGAVTLALKQDCPVRSRLVAQLQAHPSPLAKMAPTPLPAQSDKPRLGRQWPSGRRLGLCYLVRTRWAT